jgi:UDP-2-acetamido-2,6-beta-L-arabino-hexul-4-ose reductase
MSRIRLGITGESGFIGSFVRLRAGQRAETITCIPCKDAWFDDESLLDAFVSQCDTIVHLAAMNRASGDPEEIYDTNMRLVRALRDAMLRRPGVGHIVFASSLQEERDNPYGRSKRDGRFVLEEWAREAGSVCSSIVIPNVFGPYCRPHYNSVIATFSHQLVHRETPRIDIDAEIPFLHVWDLAVRIIEVVEQGRWSPDLNPFTPSVRSVSSLLATLQEFAAVYLGEGRIPPLPDPFSVALFNTFRSYIPVEQRIFEPVAREDPRGYLIEILKTGTGGQVFFSRTEPGITRGNHYHTRKIERFCVVAGEAVIRTRRIGRSEINTYNVSGEAPKYLDMPVFCTHSIENVADVPLLTLFWSNEVFDPVDADTYFEPVIGEQP